MSFVPDRGDIVIVNLSPTVGHEQSGIRPVFVVTPKNLNAKTGLVIICPITKKIKNYPFEVILENEARVEGAILTDQIRTIDFTKRRTKFVTSVGVKTINSVLLKINRIINFVVE